MAEGQPYVHHMYISIHNIYIYICSKLFSHHLGNLSGQSQANPGVFDLKPKGFKGFTVVFHQLATSRWPVQACWTFGAKPCCWTPLHCICSVTGKVGPFLGRISVPSDEMAGRFAIKWGIPNGLWWCLQMIYSYIYIYVCVCIPLTTSVDIQGGGCGGSTTDWCWRFVPLFLLKLNHVKSNPDVYILLTYPTLMLTWSQHITTCHN